MSKTFTLLSTLLTGLCATAQTDSVRTRLLDEVVVTANKTEQKQSTTGKVVTVITKQQIEKSAGKTIAQLLNEQAGVQINGALSNAGSTQTVFMRGAASGRTLILMDGIPVNDPSQITSDFDLNFFSINDVERIEICKGAQSTLYGSDAIAGVINIITTKSHITKPVNVKATVSGGSFNTWKTNLQVYGKTGKLSYTTRYAHLVSDGFSAAYDSTGSKNFDKDGYNGTTANAALQYQANTQLLLKAFTQYSAYTAGIDASGFTDKNFYNINNKNHTSGSGFVYKPGMLSLTGNYQYSKQSRNYDDNASIGAPLFSMNDYNAITHYAELYTSAKLGAGFTLLAGGDYRYARMNNEYRSVSAFGPYNSKFNDTSMSQTSGYLSLHYNNQRFSAEIGGRLTNHSKYGTHYTYTINPAYAFDEHFRIFGSIATGFKAPSIYQLYSGSGNPDLKAELATNYEAGLQHSYKGFSDRLVFFYRNTDNGIDYNSVTFKYFNYVKQMTRGIEYEVNIQPLQRLTITGNYTFIAAQETTQSRVNFKDTVYNYSLRRPAHMFNITAGYQFGEHFYASINGRYVGERNDVGSYKKPDVPMDSYFIVGAYAEYHFLDKFKLFFDWQNIGNRKFFEIRGYSGIPSMFNTGLTLNW
ncbi:TonB-dependent receptor plug domain-containing protein [Sediminibacterium soli]|uniref:TonB-dependent receptor plug domain-containing protein n=1 Tax=Sediminibacterium soli TaxID=2698829 RepID=UPI00137B6B9F|nr:TonB-dependent receptor [Sediminibacterium soli]NCI45417.1 TonB-dependent receptor [Sediminibacterium soli]